MTPQKQTNRLPLETRYYDQIFKIDKGNKYLPCFLYMNYILQDNQTADEGKSICIKVLQLINEEMMEI